MALWAYCRDGRFGWRNKREEGFGEGSSVKVGKRVGVSVMIAKGVAVHVAGSGTGVNVDVGGHSGQLIQPGKGLKRDSGEMKIATK